MKKSNFSEKEFEILCCSEMLSLFNCDFYFPTQRKEVNKGYDARFKHKKFKALFFQFKVPYQYQKSIFNNNSPMLGSQTHKTKQSRQKQHNLLVKLNKKNSNSAFYFVPLFIDRSDLISYFRSKKLFDFCLGLIPYHKLNDGNHNIYYDAGNAVQKCDSEEKLYVVNIKELDLCKSEELKYEDFVDYLHIQNQELFQFLGKHNIFMLYKIIDD